MSTITTKQLRENMPQIIRDLQRGKSVQLSYRHRIIGVLQPVLPAHKTLKRGSPDAIRQGLAGLHDIHIPDYIKNDPRSIKQQIADLRDRKHT